MQTRNRPRFFVQVGHKTTDKCTDKSLSEALIFASIKPQYDNRLFMELPWKLQAQNMGRTFIKYPPTIWIIEGVLDQIQARKLKFLYFRYIHGCIPNLHKKSLMETYLCTDYTVKIVLILRFSKQYFLSSAPRPAKWDFGIKNHIFNFSYFQLNF
jgi:hypothetical protein